MEVQVPLLAFSDIWGRKMGLLVNCWVEVGVQASADTTLAGKNRGASLLLLMEPSLYTMWEVASLPLGSGQILNLQQASFNTTSVGKGWGASLPPAGAKSPGSQVVTTDMCHFCPVGI